MGPGKEVPAKSFKPVSLPQEAPTAPSYHDWSSSIQAFYGAGVTHSFSPSTVASPTPHPYMWGGQHPLMPPYGTPIPYPAIYPPGGVYAHPNMAMTPGLLQGTTELNGNVIAGKECASSKKVDGNSRNQVYIGSTSRDAGKATSGSGNDAGTQSAESGSEDPSDASENDDHNENFHGNKRGSFDQMLADGANAQNTSVPANFQTLIANNPVSSVAATNLNIGMGLWNASPADTGALNVNNNARGVVPTVSPSGTMNNQWIQDERELKRQKRKLSNRESARRSRLRKQAECEELQQRVETLSEENRSLREELVRLSVECEKLTSENKSMKGELTSLCGPGAVSDLQNNDDSVELHQSLGDGDDH